MSFVPFRWCFNLLAALIHFKLFLSIENNFYSVFSNSIDSKFSGPGNRPHLISNNAVQILGPTVGSGEIVKMFLGCTLWGD